MTEVVNPCRRAPHDYRQDALTLVELLLLLCILAILLALVIPAIHNVREQSRIAYCLGNLRQIGLALSTYMADNQGFFPPGEVNIRAYNPETGDTKASNKIWCEFLHPYLSGPKVEERGLFQKEVSGTCFDCPSNRASTQPLGFDYAYNAYTLMSLGGRLEMIPSPSFQIVVSEGNWHLNSSPHNVRPVHSLMLGSPGSNYLFADGHAEWSQRYHLMTPLHPPWRPFKQVKIKRAQ